MLEHFEDQKYRSNHDPSDRKENVKQINHWNVIRVVFHVSSFLSLSNAKIARRAGGTFAWRPRFLPTGGKPLGLSESDDRPGLASPKRTSTAAKARHASAVSSNTGPYADPSH
jgi:hypothetical protein